MYCIYPNKFSDCGDKSILPTIFSFEQQLHKEKKTPIYQHPTTSKTLGMNYKCIASRAGLYYALRFFRLARYGLFADV